MCARMGKGSVCIEVKGTAEKIFLVPKLVPVFSHHFFTPALCKGVCSEVDGE